MFYIKKRKEKILIADCERLKTNTSFCREMLEGSLTNVLMGIQNVL